MNINNFHAKKKCRLTGSPNAIRMYNLERDVDKEDRYFWLLLRERDLRLTTLSKKLLTKDTTRKDGLSTSNDIWWNEWWKDEMKYWRKKDTPQCTGANRLHVSSCLHQPVVFSVTAGLRYLATINAKKELACLFKMDQKYIHCQYVYDKQLINRYI